MDLRRKHLIRLVISTIGLTVLVMAFAKLGSGRLLEPAEDVTSPVVATTAADLPDVDPPVDAPPAAPALSEAAVRDAELRSLLAGYWTHVESGQHWIENRADGTSRMLLKLDFVASLLYGQESTMQLAWEVKDGVLTHTIVEGAPQKSVDAIIRDYGKVRKYTILETTPDRMLLETRDGKKKKELWTRTPPPKEWQ